MTGLLNEMADAINRAVGDAMKQGYRGIKPTPGLDAAIDAIATILPPTVTSAFIRRTLRLEVDRENEYRMRADAYGALGQDWRSKQEPGPKKFVGVDCYVVDELPAPGWRLVNPLLETRRATSWDWR